MPIGSARAPSGALSPDLIRSPGPRVSRETIDRFLALEDLSGTVSDVLDKLGVRGAVGASILRPSITSARIVGAAVTVRNVPQELQALKKSDAADNRMTEIEGINQGEAGDVLVIQGLRDT